MPHSLPPRRIPFCNRRAARRFHSVSALRLQVSIYKHMETSWKKTVIHLLIAFTFFWIAEIAVRAQEAPVAQERELQKKEVELETAKIELEKKKLELEAVKKELKARETEGRLTMNLQGDVLFDYGKSDLRPEAQSALEKVAIVISQFPDSNVLIRGFTDAKGPPAANLVLSQKRAASVKNWLVKNGAITETKIATEGYGEKEPVAANTNPDGTDNPEGRQQNRRVEITVEKPPAPR
jgi:outer membrane protein OmpA-like peptidoglycan-associated protein